MRPIKPNDIKAARYAVHLRNLAAYINHLAADIEDNPTDVRAAREALRHVPYKWQRTLSDLCRHPTLQRSLTVGTS